MQRDADEASKMAAVDFDETVHTQAFGIISRIFYAFALGTGKSGHYFYCPSCSLALTEIACVSPRRLLEELHTFSK